MSQRRSKTKFHVGGRSTSRTQGDTSVRFVNQRIVTRIVNAAEVKRRRTTNNRLEDAFGSWMPFADMGNDDLVAMAETIASAPPPLEDDEHSVPKCKRHQSDDPMRRWRSQIPSFLDEFLRRESLGRHFDKPVCASCRQSHHEIFRCLHCGPFLECRKCIVLRHQQLPLHIPQVWNGGFWEDSSLYKAPRPGGVGLGMVYQLGHHGFACARPQPVRELVVMDVTGVVQVSVREQLRHPHGWLSQLLNNDWYPATVDEPSTCATFRVLELFRILKVVGNMNAHDFVGSLERLSDATFTEEVPDRYKAFGRMSRQFDHLKRGKRSGRASEVGGIASTPPGALAVRCWACPDPVRNLPVGWDKVAPENEFLYALILALDANFRLKNRIRANERYDPALGDGLSYFVESSAYKQHLRHYVVVVDVSTCIAFAALMQKETRLTTGLRVSGVGGCVCARHGVVRPLGLGDLQKGERYANMDWIFMAAVGGSDVKRLVVSYDIACQWKQKLRARAVNLSENPAIPTDLANYIMQYGLPVWHAIAHEASCQAANSLSHAVGVGRTDGEGIERTWAILNPISFSTKEMGEGNRHDTIDDKVDHINWEKNVRQGDTLARKLIIAIAERDTQIREFELVDKSLDNKLRAEWERRIAVWDEDPSQPNPYLLDSKDGPSGAAVLAELKKAELEEMRRSRAGPGDALAGKMTAAAFIQGALQLEDQQRRIRCEVAATPRLTAERSSQLAEQRVAFFKKLWALESNQTIFMPGVAELRAAEEDARDPDLPPPAAEKTKLWLPSDLTELDRAWACKRGLPNTEAKLREVQCAESLEKLRGHLHTKTHLIDMRNSFAIGQSATTRFGSLIGRVGGQVEREATRYRDALGALERLGRAKDAPQFKPLLDDDLRVNEEPESDAKARAALGKLGSAQRARNEPSVAKKMLPVSWIWKSGRGGDMAELHDSVHVQWTKSRARRDRWVEEVQLLEEEMRRVLRSLEWAEKEWMERASSVRVMDEELAAGMAAYGTRQAALQRRIAESFRAKWSASKAEAVRLVVQADAEESDGDGD
ncbi:hypothetical protein C8F01DRAFT_1264802 [Mycena amicta]|nr:hypothetical protein C8F01DRAFT_1264802 [Mycena amicta]